MQTKKKNGLVWFGNNLRVNDNMALALACEQHETVVGVFCFDPNWFKETGYGFKKTEKFRARFLIESVEELKQHLLKHNIPLYVHFENPKEVLPKLIEKYGFSHIYLQKEWTQEETDTLKQVKKSLLELLLEVEWVEIYDQFLFHPEDIPYSSFSSIPDIFTEFRKKCEKFSEVKNEVNINGFYNPTHIENQTEIPTRKALGFQDFETDPRSAFPFKGGEIQAIARLNEYFWETKKLAWYKKTRNGLLGKDYSSKFSPWLANGCISARQIFWEVKKFEAEVTKNQDTYWLIFELIWRDYFKYVSLKHGNKLFKIGGIFNRNYQWKNDKNELHNWINGQTDEPFVNANMKELALTGWMSNRGRQNVASYWAMHREQDWRIGAAYFESMLLDYDVHSNWGNWQYNSGVGNDPRNRTFNIKRQAEMYDGESRFQKKWLGKDFETSSSQTKLHF